VSVLFQFCIFFHFVAVLLSDITLHLTEVLTVFLQWLVTNHMGPG